MQSLILAAYFVLSLIAVVQAAAVAVQTWEHRRFARSRLMKLPRHGCRGRVLLVVPCRGSDVGLEKNLRTLLRQDYDEYQVRFVVESADDPVYPVIRRVIAGGGNVPAEIIVAGRAEGSGQKVHNLLVATADLPEGVEYLAFVDSDARLRRRWLRALVSRLDQPGVAAATGYRWFVPGRPSLANHLLYSLNTNVAIFLGVHPPTVVWGGSWAIRRELFQSLDIRGAWTGTVDDDLVAAGVFRRLKLTVAFEPACMVISPSDSTFSELFWFVRRQYFIVRFYLRPWLTVILLLSTGTNLAMWGSLGAAVWGGWQRASWAWVPASVFGALYAAGVAGGLFRQAAAVTYFPKLRRYLRAARWFEVWSGPLVTLANWVGLVASLIGNTITWRGISYRLRPDGRISAIRRGDAGWQEVPPNAPVPSRGDAPQRVAPRPLAWNERATGQLRCDAAHLHSARAGSYCDES